MRVPLCTGSVLCCWAKTLDGALWYQVTKQAPCARACAPAHVRASIGNLSSRVQAHSVQVEAQKLKKRAEFAEAMVHKKEAEFRRKRQERRRRTESAVTIQAAARGFMARHRLQVQLLAARNIQRWFQAVSRYRKAKRTTTVTFVLEMPTVELTSEAQAPIPTPDEVHAAAVKIQVCSRCWAQAHRLLVLTVLN